MTPSAMADLSVECRVLNIDGKAKTVRIRRAGTVEELATAVHYAFDVAPERQRLICGGRIMKPSELLQSYKLGDAVTTVHLFPRSDAAPPADQASSAAASRAARPEPEAAATDSDDDDEEAQLQLLREHFDEVSRLSIRGALDVERGRAARDEFQRSRADADLGTPREFVWGFFMGFLLGFIMLLYLWERSVSHRQKMGILTGASCQIVGKYLHSGSFRWALI